MVLTPPDGLATETMRLVLGRRWGLMITSIDYQPVGFGSHHWHVVDSTDTSWFVTVDELYTKRLTMADLDDDAFDRLYAALATARDLRSAGASFVIAPQLTLDGHPLVRIAPGLGIALYPFVDGHSYTFHEMLTPAHRAELLQLLAHLHSVPLSTVAHAHVDDFGIPNRDALELMMQPGDQTLVAAGPYAAPMRALLAANAERLAGALDRYDDLVVDARRRPAQNVLTHGEPHPGNTMHAQSGLVLIDWDTVLIAPPERDLWSLESGDGAVSEAYTATTGRRPRSFMMDMYRTKWDLADLAAYAGRFAGAHVGSEDDEKSWTNVAAVLAGLDQ